MVNVSFDSIKALEINTPLFVRREQAPAPDGKYDFKAPAKGTTQ